MVQGNQGYLQFQIEDEEGKLLDIVEVSKVQFNIDKLTKTYDGKNNEVIYNEKDKIFNIWVTEKETFKFEKIIPIQSRVMFKGETHYREIMGTNILNVYWQDCLVKEILDV